jgi:multidrug efflux system membrane fusion protein
MEQRPSSRIPARRRFAALFVLFAMAGLVLWLAFGFGVNRGRPLNAAPAPAPAPVPVTTALAEKADFPVLLSGLGTAQAFNTVIVRTRVDGQIEKIAFSEGQMVRQGDLLAQIDARPFKAALDQAKAKKQQDEANLANARTDLQRYTDLSQRNAVSAQQLATQKSMVAQITAQIAGDQAAIDNAETQLSYTTIRSPLTGVAGFRLIDQGNIVNATAQTGIVNITQIEPIFVVFTAPEDQLDRINRAFKTGRLAVTALTPDGKRVLSKGVLAVVNNEVDTASGTVRLKASFHNFDHALWPGLSVSTELLVETLRGVTVIPEDAVKRGPRGLYAYVVNGAGAAEIRDIKVSHSGNGRALVDQGLAPGERVVTAGQYRLAPGAPVKLAGEAGGGPERAK